MMNTKAARDFRFRPSKGKESFSSIFAVLVGMMKRARAFFHLVMFFAFHDNQIIRGVIEAISVFMMDNLIFLQGSAYHLLGDHPVLIKVPVTNSAYYSITRSVHMTALPVMMISPKAAPTAMFLSVRYRSVLDLAQPGRRKSLIAHLFVLLRSYSVSLTKMGCGYLRAAFKSAKFTLDCLHVSSVAFYYTPKCNNCNVGM